MEVASWSAIASPGLGGPFMSSNTIHPKTRDVCYNSRVCWNHDNGAAVVVVAAAAATSDKEAPSKALSSALAWAIPTHPALPSRLSLVFCLALTRRSNLPLSSILSYFPFPPFLVAEFGIEPAPVRGWGWTWAWDEESGVWSMDCSGDPGGFSVFRSSSISPSNTSSVWRRSFKITNLAREVREVWEVRPICWNRIG